MITARTSLTGEYHLAFSGDPAFDKPEEPKREQGEVEEAWLERMKVFYLSPEWKEWSTKLRLARETGTPEAWQSVLKPGGKPSLFVMRQVPGILWRKIEDKLAAQAIGEREAQALCFRAAITGFRDLELDITVKQAADALVEERIASPDVVKALDAVHPDIVSELGWVVFNRMRSPNPLS